MAWKIQDDATPGTAVDGTGENGAPGTGQSYFFDTTSVATDGAQTDFTADAVNAEADNSSSLEALRQEQAEAAGVKDARFAGYAAVLANYEARSDTEPLADRRARELAVDPADQDFTRAADYTGNSTTAETTRTSD